MILEGDKHPVGDNLHANREGDKRRAVEGSPILEVLDSRPMVEDNRQQGDNQLVVRPQAGSRHANQVVGNRRANLVVGIVLDILLALFFPII